MADQSSFRANIKHKRSSRSLGFLPIRILSLAEPAEYRSNGGLQEAIGFPDLRSQIAKGV